MKYFTSTLFFNLLVFSVLAQHTFSIVAVDTTTMEVGSAGATCLTSADCGGCGGAVIISNLVPGIGAINSQATVCIPNSNLNIGINRMKQGDTAQEILDFMLNNDACSFGNTTNRQYGIARLDSVGGAEARGYTGSNALNAANHREGINYSIQGNILIGKHVLDSMEARFLRETRSLPFKLMAAMQGANIPGADSRCLNDGISSKSSFLRVAKPGDTDGNFNIDIIIPSTLVGIDPIDALQAQFDMTVITAAVEPEAKLVKIYPNPVQKVVNVEGQTGQLIRLFNTTGVLVAEQTIKEGITKILLPHGNEAGAYFYQLLNADRQSIQTGKLIFQQ